MPKYTYKAVAANGQIIKGETEAASSESVIRELQEAGHLPVGAWEIHSRDRLQYVIRKLIKTRKSAGIKEVVIFMNELATLLQAGLPLDNALKMMEKLASSPVMKELIHTVLKRVEAGGNLSDAMMEYPQTFSRLQISIIRAGEASGDLYKVIYGLAGYLERMSELRGSVISVLIYPVILLVMAVLSLFVLMTFVVPGFVPLFEDMGQALPLLTRITFGLAEMLQQTWWLILCLMIIAIWYAGRQLSYPASRNRFDRWSLKLPYIGNVLGNIDMARMARTLGTLLSNGVPLLSAVSLARDVVNNSSLAGVINDAAATLERGQGFGKVLAESQLFPALGVQLIQVGEQSGNLDTMLLKVADIYDQEIRVSLKRMLTLLEPLLILGLGGLIGAIIISILMALLALNDLVI